MFCDKGKDNRAVGAEPVDMWAGCYLKG